MVSSFTVSCLLIFTARIFGDNFLTLAFL
jgi:hypothetical protein